MQFTTANSAELRDFSAGPTLLDAAKAPYRLGWAFLLAWVFCVFYLQLFGTPSGDALINAGLAPTPLALFFDTFPVFVSVATLAAVIAVERRMGPPSAHPRLELATAVVASAGTPLLLVSADSIAATTVIFAIASLLTGIGSGVMWVSWGEHYARIPQDEVELFGPVSAVLGALITLGVSAMSGWIAVAVVASFPLLSGLCLLIARKENEEASAEPSGDTADAKASLLSALSVPATMGRTVMGIMAACLFVCIAGALVEGRSTFESSGVQVALFVSTLFTLAIAFISVVGPRRISISFFYRWMCPALVLGFAAIIMFGDALGSYLAFTMSVAARFAFCLITQMYFARVSSEGKMTAVQAYGWGWISVHLGDFLGVLATAAFAEAIHIGMITLDQVAATSMALLVMVTMFVIDDKRSFASPEAEGSFSASESAASLNRTDAQADSAAAPGTHRDGSPALSLEPQRTEAPRNTGIQSENEPNGVSFDTGKNAQAGSAAPNENSFASHAEPSASDVCDPAGDSAPATRGSTGDAAPSESAALSATPDADRMPSITPNMNRAPSITPDAGRTPSIDERIAAIAREHGLTRRESEVFSLLARGRSIPYVRDALVISRETAATHAKHIYAKLDVHSRQELIDMVANGQ